MNSKLTKQSKHDKNNAQFKQIKLQNNSKSFQLSDV